MQLEEPGQPFGQQIFLCPHFEGQMGQLAGTLRFTSGHRGSKSGTEYLVN